MAVRFAELLASSEWTAAKSRVEQTTLSNGLMAEASRKFEDIQRGIVNEWFGTRAGDLYRSGGIRIREIVMERLFC